MSNHSPIDSSAEIEQSLRLQKRLRLQAVAGILVTTLLVGGIASYQFYQSRQLSVIEQLQKELQFAALALGAKLNEYRSIALQVTGRSSIRSLLQNYNQRNIDLQEFRSLLIPKLNDVLRLSPEVAGIRQFDNQHSPVLQIGELLPDLVLPLKQLSDQAMLGLPIRQQDRQLLAVAVAINSSSGERVGSNLVFFDTTRSREIIDRLSSRFVYDNRIIFCAMADGKLQQFLFGATLQNPDLPIPDTALLKKMNDGIDNWVHRISEPDEADQILVQVKVPHTDWQLIFQADASAILQPARDDSLYLFASILLLLIAGIAVTSRLIYPTVGKIMVGSQALRELNERNQQLLEETLRNKQLLDDILNHTPAVIFIKDLEGRYVHINQAYADERGLSIEEIIGKADNDLHPPETAELFRANDRIAITRKDPVIIEEQFEIDGEMQSFITTKFPLKDIDGETYAICGIATNVTSFKQSEELRNALDTAKAENQAKSSFLANMSHELRTPLHGILSYSELGQIRVDSVSHDKLAQYFENIHISGKRLLDLLNDLLDLSKLEAGKFELVYRNSDLVQIFNDCIEEQSPGINDKAIKIAKPESSAETYIDCDRGKIFQVFRNLLNNAIKFSRSDGLIEFQIKGCQLNRGSEVRDAVEIRLIDDGDGIDSGDLEKIFDKFTQSKNRIPGGTGLGLSISREIILLHEGEIHAQNNSERGVALVIKLPRKKPSDSVQLSEMPSA